MNTIVIIIAAVIIVATAIAVTYVATVKRKTKTKNMAYGSTNKKRQGLISNVQYLRWFNTLSSNFVTKKEFNKLADHLASMSVYTHEEIHAVATKYYLIANGSMIGLIIFTLIVSRDLFTTTLVSFLAIVIKQQLITKQLHSISLKVDYQFKKSLELLKQEYMITQAIDAALVRLVPRPLVKNMFDSVFEILTGDDNLARLDIFYKSYNNPMMRTFATVCYKIFESGDSDESGAKEASASPFVKAITQMELELDNQILNEKRKKIAYGTLEWMPVIPVIAMMFLTQMVATVIPGATVIAYSLLGLLTKVAVVVAAIIGYKMVAASQYASETVVGDDRGALVLKFAKDDNWMKFASKFVPTGARKAAKLDWKLNSALSRLSRETYYLKKILYSLLAFTTTFILCIIMVVLVRNYIVDSKMNTGFAEVKDNGPGAASYQLMEEKNLRALDKKLLASPVLPNDEELTKLVKRAAPRKKGMSLNPEIIRIKYKHSQYYATVFGPPMVVASFAMGAAGWFFPTFQLRNRRKLTAEVALDDVLQLQTLLIMLSTSGANVADCLYWMEKQSTIHKKMLFDCLDNYHGEPEIALDRLKRSVPIEEFKSLVRKLEIAHSSLSVREAFSDLEMNRNSTIETRKVQSLASMYRQRNLCKPYATFPMQLMVYTQIMLPVGLVVYNQAMSTVGQLGALK